MQFSFSTHTRPRRSRLLMNKKCLLAGTAKKDQKGFVNFTICNVATPLAIEKKPHTALGASNEDLPHLPLPPDSFYPKLLRIGLRMNQQQTALAQTLDALKDCAQTLAWMQLGECRGYSERLLTTEDALKKAAEAIKASQQAPEDPQAQGEATNFAEWFETEYEAANGFVSSGDPMLYNEKQYCKAWAKKAWDKATPPASEPIGWYCVDKAGMATLCADQEDALQNAKLAQQDWPNNGPYRAVQLCEYADHIEDALAMVPAAPEATK